MKATNALLYFLAAIAAWTTFSACTYTVHPDGSRTYGLDANAAAAVATTIIANEIDDAK